MNRFDWSAVELPPTIQGMAIRRSFGGYLVETLAEPIQYTGYRVGSVIHGWTEARTPSGHSELIEASANDPGLIFGGALMDSVLRARGDAELITRQQILRQGTDTTPAAVPVTHERINQQAHRVTRLILDEYGDAVPELADLFPFRGSWGGEALQLGQVLVWRLRDVPGMVLAGIGEFRGADLDIARRLATGAMHLPELVGNPRWLSRRSFLFVGDDAPGPSGGDRIREAACQWADWIMLPEAGDLNLRRVQRAIPEPPAWQPHRIFASCLVLTSTTASSQATAFALDGVGVVTCAHSVHEDTTAFRWDSPGREYPVRILRLNRDLDLAVIEVPGLDVPPLTAGDPAGLQVMSWVAVTGFPNHHLGDQPTFKPGQIVSFRRRHAITMPLTNAGIVRGMSGGPVVDRNGKVVGIASTGAESDQDIGSTEKHGMIPVDALALLGT